MLTEHRKQKCREYSKRYREKHRDRVEAYKVRTRDEQKERVKNWAKRNPEKMRSYNKKWRSNNRQNERDRHRKNRKKNPELYSYHASLRKARILRATPEWVDLEELKKIYADCPPAHHVDHIVPLMGDGVRGLHVPWNLQYLPALENLKKGNRL